MGRPDRGVERLLAHQVGEDRAGLLACVGGDVDPLEEVAIGRVGVDLALGRRTRDRQGGQDLRRPVLEADDRRHLAETGEIGRLEVEHRHAVAVDPRIDVDDEIAAGRLGLHRGDPVGRLLLVQLDAEARRRLDDLGDRLVPGGVRGHDVAPPVSAGSEYASPASRREWHMPATDPPEPTVPAEPGAGST